MAGGERDRSGYQVVNGTGCGWRRCSCCGRVVRVVDGDHPQRAGTGGRTRPAFGVHVTDPLRERAAVVFAADLAAARVPSIRAIRAQLHVGQLRAQQLRDYLAAGTARRPEVPLREQLAGGVKPTPRLKSYCNAQVTA
jgi:hypothetical protein